MAKIIIDIQDAVYRVLKEDIYPIPDTERLALVFKTLVKKGTPLPDHATNGDVIQALYPNATNYGIHDGLVHICLDNRTITTFTSSWWNSPFLG